MAPASHSSSSSGTTTGSLLSSGATHAGGMIGGALGGALGTAVGASLGTPPWGSSAGEMVGEQLGEVVFQAHLHMVVSYVRTMSKVGLGQALHVWHALVISACHTPQKQHRQKNRNRHQIR